MPAFQDQQALQQLLSGMNTMQMQAGLMPGGVPAYNPTQNYAPQQTQTQTPAQFSNNLQLHMRNTFSPVPSMPPMYGGVSPVPRNDFANQILPGAQLGGGWGMARQTAQNRANSNLMTAQGGAGLGTGIGFGSATTAIGMALGGPIGAGIGMGIGYLGGGAASSMGEMPFNPYIDQRQRTMQLQNMSMNTVRGGGGGTDLSASGLGFSANASQRLERNLMNMSDNRGFKRDTEGMFNRQDMMKITQLSSQMGMLDNAQTVDQMSREMGKIGRALSTFMKVVEEPDVQEALRMMGKMRTIGMNLPEMNVAATNARTFARMAGTSVKGIMSQGMQGAEMYQQMGMTGGAGLSVGMAGAGAAGALATTMDPRQLALLGGRGNIANTFMTGAAKMSQMDMMMPGLAKMGKNGVLEVDQDALMSLARGETSVGGLARQSGQKMGGIGAERFINAWSTQQADFKDKLTSSMGGLGSMLMPMIMARSVMESGATKDFGAALRLSGMDEQEARTYEVAAKSENFFRDMQNNQNKAEKSVQQNRSVNRQKRQSDKAGTERFRGIVADILDVPLYGTSRQTRKYFGEIGNTISNFVNDDYGGNLDVYEQQAAAGGGPILQAMRESKYGGAQQIKQTQDRVKRAALTTESLQGGAPEFNRRIAARIKAEEERSEFRDRQGQGGFSTNGAMNLFDQKNPFEIRLKNAENRFFGPTSETKRETVFRNEGYHTRMARYVGLGEFKTTEEINARSSEMETTGALVERARSSKYRMDTSITQSMAKRLNTGGLKQERLAGAMGAASAGVRNYVGSLQGLFGTAGDYSEAAAETQVRKSMAGTYSEAEIDAALKDKEFMSQAYALAEGGLNEKGRETLDKVVSAGADNASSRTGHRQRITQNDVEAQQGKVLAGLGLWGDKAETADKQALLGVFSDTGKNAELKKRLMVIKARRMAGTDEEKEAASVMEAKLKLKHKEEFGVASAAVEGTASGISKLAMRSLGEQFNKYGFTSKDTTNMLDKTTDAAVKIQRDMVYSGIVENLDEGGAKIYNDSMKAGESSKERMKKLSAYSQNVTGSLGNLAADVKKQLDAGKLSEDALLQSTVKGLGKAARSAIAGGGTQVEAKSNLTDASEAAVTSMSDWADRTFRRADDSYKKLDAVAGNLNKAAKALGAKDMTDIQDIQDVASAGAPPSQKGFMERTSDAFFGHNR